MASIMTYLTIALLACCVVLQSSTSLISDNWDVDELYKQLHDPAKGKIDIECETCFVVVDVIQTLVRGNRSEDEIAEAIVELCVSLQMADQLVCSEIVPEFKDEVLYVFMSIALGPKEVCGAIIGGSCGHYYNPWQQNWTVMLPDKPKPPIVPLPALKSDNPIRVLHLSDIHVDLLYTEGLNTECGEPLCCRPPNKPVSPAAGPWGDYLCDVPLTTINELFEHLNRSKDQFDWIYWTGDLPAHNVWSQSREDQLGVIDLLTDQMKLFFGDKKVYPTLGNHESAPVNSFPPPFITGKNSNQWLLNGYQTDFSNWLPSNTASTIEKGGYYSTQLVPGLKLISLNMNYGNSQNWWLLINSTDPAGQLEWLANELQESENNGEKVHIIGHIPPGGCMDVFRWNYYRIINRYESTIAGQFFGHTHHDEFHVFYDMVNSSRAFSVAYMGPSVTTYQCNNPAYRIYEVEGKHDNSSFQMVNHHTYFTDLTEANARNNLTWQYEYNAKDAYKLDNLHPQEWSKLVDRMKTDDSLFDLFYKYFHRHETDSCTGGCKSGMLCVLNSCWSHNSSYHNDVYDPYLGDTC